MTPAYPKFDIIEITKSTTGLRISKTIDNLFVLESMR